MITINTQLLNTNPAEEVGNLVAALGAHQHLYRVGAELYVSAKDGGGALCGILPVPPGHLIDLLEGAGVAQTMDDNERHTPAHSKPAVSRRIEAILRLPSMTERVMEIRSQIRGPAVRAVATVDHHRFLPRGAGYAEHTLCLPSPVQAPFNPDPPADYPHLRTLWSGVNFGDKTYYRGNLIGYTVAMFARSAFSEDQPFPLLLIDSGRRSAGKTSVATALCWLLTGAAPPDYTYTVNEDELEKKLRPSVDRPGPNFLFFDNVQGKRGSQGGHQIRGQFLARVVTSRSVTARVLHEGPRPIFDPVVAITMNGAVVAQDLADRTFRISTYRQPGAPQVPLIPHPVSYAIEHRAALIQEIFSILYRVRLYGPGARAYRTRMYWFEQIVEQASALVGEPASFDPTVLDSADSFVRELTSLMSPGEPAAFEALRTKAISDPGTRELRAWFDRLEGSSAHHWKELREACADLVGRQFRINGDVVSFEIHDEALVMRREAPAGP